MRVHHGGSPCDEADDGQHQPEGQGQGIIRIITQRCELNSTQLSSAQLSLREREVTRRGPDASGSGTSQACTMAAPETTDPLMESYRPNMHDALGEEAEESMRGTSVLKEMCTPLSESLYITTKKRTLSLKRRRARSRTNPLEPLLMASTSDGEESLL